MTRGITRDIELGTMIEEAARRNPSGTITVDIPLSVRPELGTTFTVSDLAELVDDLAGRLVAAGVTIGARVVVYKSNNADILAITCALARVGAVPVLLSPALPGAIADELIEIAEPAFVLADATKLDDVAPVQAGFGRSAGEVILTSGAVPGLRSLDRIEYVTSPPAVEIDPAAVRIVTHTSGTTGLPKLVEQSAGGLAAHIRLQMRIAGLFRVREPWAMCVSFVHARTYSALALGLIRRMPLALLANHDIDSVRSIFETFVPGLVETHPNTFVQWEALADDPRGPLRNVRCYISTFDAIHPRTVRILLGATQRKLPFYFQAYGQTETGPVTVRIYTRGGAQRAHGRCVGYGIPGFTRVRLRNGRRGPSPIEVLSKGRGINYLGQAERFNGQIDGKWWSMGDLGVPGRWGCVHLLDREVDHLAGIDSVLDAEDTLMNRLPDLTEVILVEAPSGIQPVICTRGDLPLGAAEWERASAGLPTMLAPIHSRWDDLPQTATFKIKRAELQRLLVDGAVRPASSVR